MSLAALARSRSGHIFPTGSIGVPPQTAARWPHAISYGRPATLLDRLAVLHDRTSPLRHPPIGRCRWRLGDRGDPRGARDRLRLQSDRDEECKESLIDLRRLGSYFNAATAIGANRLNGKPRTTPATFSRMLDLGKGPGCPPLGFLDGDVGHEANGTTTAAHARQSPAAVTRSMIRAPIDPPGTDTDCRRDVDGRPLDVKSIEIQESLARRWRR